MISMSRPIKAIPITAWPEIDQQRWHKAQASSSTASMESETVRRIALAYGRWLHALSEGGKLDHRASPGDRVRQAAVAEYIAALQCAGLSPSSIVTYLGQLRRALKILEPGKDFGWVSSPEHRRVIEKPKGLPFLQEFSTYEASLWRAGTGSRESSATPARDLRLSWHTLRAAGYAYRNWLRFLRKEGLLADDIRPDARLTEGALRLYKSSLDEAGCSAVKVSRSFWLLRTACQIMRLPLPVDVNALTASTRTTPSVMTIKFEEWPSLDRRLWMAGSSPGDLLDDPSYGAKLRTDTVEAIIRGYGCWLKFLQSGNMLDPDDLPASRTTADRVRGYLATLKSRGLSNSTILGRLFRLRSALRIMQPDADVDWLTSPGGRSLSSFFPVSRRPLKFIHSRVLYEWGRDLMRDAIASLIPQRRQVQYRDGLLIALLAARAPRLSSVAKLRIGRNVERQRLEARIIFEKELMKNGKPIEYSVPPSLAPAIERYVTVERREMMGDLDHDVFWVSRTGRPLEKASIKWIIRSRSKARFGRTFGPHYFRHCLGTTGPLEDPVHPGVAGSILNITGRVLREHYTRAGEAEAARRFHSSLREQRERTRSVAGREFRRRRRA